MISSVSAPSREAVRRVRDAQVALVEFHGPAS